MKIIEDEFRKLYDECKDLKKLYGEALLELEIVEKYLGSGWEETWKTGTLWKPKLCDGVGSNVFSRKRFRTKTNILRLI